MNRQAIGTDPRTRIIVALDLPNPAAALELVRQLSPFSGLYKIGLQLYTLAGPEILRAVQGLGGRIFLDLKLHDIPHTVARAVEAANSLGVEMLTLHLSGGRSMIDAALHVAAPEVLLLGVTVLTSADAETLGETGIDAPVEKQVLRLAKLGIECGIAGLVASPREVHALRSAFGPAIKIVTPGIRPAGSAHNDQKRAMTPAEALEAGADFIVVGRPITAARDPRSALEAIVTDVV